MGGSIGGLTAGVLLGELGCDVDIYERSSAALASRGAGIVVLPITERIFTERGADDRVSLELTHWTYLDAAGEQVSAAPVHHRFSGWNTIYRGLRRLFPDERYHLQAEMVDLAPGPDGSSLTLADGHTVAADLVLCADGISSSARRLLLPGVEPVYAGYVAWRGTTPEQALSPAAVAQLADQMLYQVLDHGHILVYTIPSYEGATKPGERLANFVWYRNAPRGDAFDAVMTDRHGELRTATVPPGQVDTAQVERAMAEAATTLAPTIAEVVTRSEDVFIQAIYDLESPRLVFGTTVLMGDAAFGVRPHLAAGQAKACADAWELRDALVAAGGDVGAALAAWEPRQLALGRATVARARAMGIRSQMLGTMVPGDPTWRFGLGG